MNHLRAMWDRADDTDRAEGVLAYSRYHDLLRRIGDHYQTPLPQTVAAFVALSPNSDYFGNLRSLVSVLQGVREDRFPFEITVSTYKHCRDRAWFYVKGHENFLDHAKGLKTRAFYHNILDPEDHTYVTVDGHIYAAWVGKNLTMKEAKISTSAYREISQDVTRIADEFGLVPNQVQATIWFTRKRTSNIIYSAQLSLFHAADDQWRTSVDVETIKPYRSSSDAIHEN